MGSMLRFSLNSEALRALMLTIYKRDTQYYCKQELSEVVFITYKYILIHRFPYIYVAD